MSASTIRPRRPTVGRSRLDQVDTLVDRGEPDLIPNVGERFAAEPRANGVDRLLAVPSRVLPDDMVGRALEPDQ